MVKTKKHLGQHFLTDLSIAQRIVNLLDADTGSNVLEIGPGEGVLSDFLIKKDINLQLIDIDSESIEHLHSIYPDLKENIVEGDFLKMSISEIFPSQLSIIGNFPYNISSQIMFKIYENRDHVDQMVGMFQKEVAKRIASSPGSKVYGILSVLMQAYYDISYEFEVGPEVFNPPPRVDSAVIKLVRNKRKNLPMSDNDFKKVVKQGFGQRRKTLRNSLKSLLQERELPEKFSMKRPEQLGVDEFIELAVFVLAS